MSLHPFSGDSPRAVAAARGLTLSTQATAKAKALPDKVFPNVRRCICHDSISNRRSSQGPSRQGRSTTQLYTLGIYINYHRSNDGKHHFTSIRSSDMILVYCLVCPSRLLTIVQQTHMNLFPISHEAPTPIHKSVVFARRECLLFTGQVLTGMSNKSRCLFQSILL